VDEKLVYTLLPALFLITIFGAALISRQVFNPINKIIEAADSISEGSDLSARINLSRAPSEMMALANTFDSMFDRLEKSFDSERQFTSDASHELRTPITVIHAQCERSRRKDASREDFIESINIIDEQSKRMSALVNQLLSITRLQQGTDRYPLSRSELSRFVRTCCEEFVCDEPRGISLELNIPEGIEARFNPTLMSSVIHNLLQNAYKYGRDDGHILVCLGEDDGGCYISVADDGIGMDEATMDNIWNRFYQADNSRGENCGAGLGLALVKEIVALHGGEVSVVSAVGEGSTFTVTLPR